MNPLQLSLAAQIVVTGDDRVYWFTELGQGVLTLPSAGNIVRTLQNEPCTREALLAGIDIPDAATALDELQALGLVESASVRARLNRLIQSWQISPLLLKREKWMKGARIFCFDEQIGQTLGLALTDLEVAIGSPEGFPVVATADYTDPRIETLSQSFAAEGLPWMLTNLSGGHTLVGPIFVPAETACWKCLAMRLEECHWLRSQLPVRLPFAETETSSARLRASAEFAAIEIARWLLGADNTLRGEIWSFSWESLETSRHKVSRFRHCPQCGHQGEEDLAASDPLTSELRRLNSAELMERIGFLMSPLTGIVSEFRNCDVPGSPVHLHGALQNPPIPPVSLRTPGNIVQAEVCSGRGWTREDAMAACAAEAVERYAVSFRGDELRFLATYRSLGEAAVHPDTVQLFSQRQFRGRTQWNRRFSGLEMVPERFAETETIEWMRGRSLTDNTPRYLPAALCLNYYRPPGVRWIGSAGTNGCAAGATIDEAILHALLELVERDALAVWWYNGLDLRPVKATGPSTDRTVLAIQSLARQGREVRIGELTTDLEIPVAIAIAVDNAGGWVFGLGAGLQIEDAVRRAVSELCQMAQTQSRPGPVPAAEANPRIVELQPPSHVSVDLKEAIERCCGRIAAAGSDAAVFDLTRPEIPLRVVRVVAPGLRPKEPRFAAGRLYEVPVRMKWLAAARNEKDLRRAAL